MMRLIIFFFLISFQSFSQSITLGNKNEIDKIYFLQGKNELYLFGKDSISIVDIERFEKVSKEKIEYPSENFISKYDITSISGEVYFLEMTGGKVYKLKGKDFIRLDKSYTHRMQMGSSTLVHNDTIFKYGGYGFWSMRNFFTFFDNQTSEWSVVSPKGSVELPKGSNLSITKVFEDDFFIYGGLNINPFEPLEWEDNKEVWKFEFKDRSWKRLGESDINFNSYDHNFSYGVNHIFYGKDDHKMMLVDVLNNKIKWFKKKTFHYALNGRHKSFFNDKVFYCFLSPYNSETLTLLKRDEDDFFGELLSEEKLYYNNEKIYYSIGVFLLGLVFLFSYTQFKKVQKRRNKIIVENDSLIFKGKILNFEIKCIQILNLLLHSEKEVISRDIMKITENPSLNYGHNTRVMNKAIEEINFKLRSILECENDLITFKKSETDKRIKVYSINTSHFFVKRTF